MNAGPVYFAAMGADVVEYVIEVDQDTCEKTGYCCATRPVAMIGDQTDTSGSYHVTNRSHIALNLDPDGMPDV